MLVESINKKTVSIIIPTYNRAQLLPRALDSVWNQSYHSIELILVDDGSTDETQTVVSNWEKCHSGDWFRLKYIPKENSGPASSRNEGLKAATGDFIYFLDSDDHMYETLLEEAVNKLEKENSDSVIFGFTFSKDDEVQGQYLPPSSLQPLHAFLLGQLWGYTSCILSRTQLLREVGSWSDELKNGEDYEFLGRTLFASNKTSILPVPLLNVSRDEGSLGGYKDSSQGLKNRLRAEETISKLVSEHDELPSAIVTAYVNRLLKTAINYFARNESDFAEGLRGLALKIDHGPWTALDLARRFVCRNGRVCCLVWVKSINTYTFLRRLAVSSKNNREKSGESLSN